MVCALQSDTVYYTHMSKSLGCGFSAGATLCFEAHGRDARTRADDDALPCNPNSDGAAVVSVSNAMRMGPDNEVERESVAARPPLGVFIGAVPLVPAAAAAPASLYPRVEAALIAIESARDIATGTLAR